MDSNFIQGFEKEADARKYLAAIPLLSGVAGSATGGSVGERLAERGAKTEFIQEAKKYLAPKPTTVHYKGEVHWTGSPYIKPFKAVKDKAGNQLHWNAQSVIDRAGFEAKAVPALQKIEDAVIKGTGKGRIAGGAGGAGIGALGSLMALLKRRKRI